MAFGDANDNLEVRLHRSEISGLTQHLQVTAGIGKGSARLVSIRDWKDHIGGQRRLGHEHILNDHERSI